MPDSIPVHDLYALRTRLGLLGREVARRAGISYAGYVQIECGRKNPSLRTLAKLARVLKVTQAQLREGA